MAVLTALALVFGAGRSAGHHPLGGRLGCVAGLPAGVEAASRAALCVFTAWISLRSFSSSSPAPPPPSRSLLAGRWGGFAGLVAPAFVMRSALRWAFSAARLHCSTCCRRRRRKHRH